MGINLLPSEEKSKIKKDKPAVETRVEMTGPTDWQKSKPSLKTGGVLTFMKSAFRRPKDSPEEEKKQVPIPEKKVLLTEHVRYEKPEPMQPKVTFVPPTAKKTASNSNTLPSSKPSVAERFQAIFHRREPAPQPEPAKTTAASGEGFPTVRTVNTHASDHALPTHHDGRVIHITTESAAPFTPRHSVKPAPARSSLFSRFFAWVRSLFHSEHHATQTKSAIPPPPPPARELKPIELVTRVERQPINHPTEKQTIPAPPKPSPIVTRVDAPVAPSVPKPPVPPAPPPPPPVKQEEKKPEPPFIAVEPKMAAPLKPTLPPPPAPPQPKLAPVVPLPAQIPSGPGAGSWLARLWLAIVGLFHRAAETSLTESIPTTDGAGHRLSSGGSVERPRGADWDVNLIPDADQAKELTMSRILVLVLVAVLSVGVVFGGWVATNWHYTNITTTVQELEQKVVSLDVSIRQHQKTVAAVNEVKRELAGIQTVLDGHVYWSELFRQLEGHTLPTVYYSSLTADAGGTVTVTGQAKDYQTAIKQLLVFEAADGFIDRAELSSVQFTGGDAATAGTAVTPSESAVGASEGPVTFSFALTVPTDIFYFPR